MAGFWKRRRGLDLEGELRASRPEPRPEFMQAVSGRLEERRRSYRGLRVSLAAAVALAMLVAVASVGGMGYAASAARSFAKSASAIVKPQKPRIVEKSAAADQYPAARAKVCYRGRVITIPASQVNTYVRRGARRVSASARVGTRCGARPRQRSAPAFTG